MTRQIWTTNYLSFAVVSILLCTSCSNGNKAPSPDNNSNSPGGVNLTFEFDSLGTESYPLSVTFSGNWSTGAGAEGSATFSKTESATIQGGSGRRTVSTAINGLKRGTWVVTAKPSAAAGAITCQHIVVPGIATLSVAGGQGPNCNPK